MRATPKHSLSVLPPLPLTADEYDQYYVRVSIDQIKAGYQRGKSPDQDYLTLYATSTHDPASRATAGPVDIGTFSTNTQSMPSPNIMTDELLVGDGDTIQIFADIQNKSHTDPSKAISDGLKIAGATITVLGAGDVLAGALAGGSLQKLLEKEGGITTLAGAVLALSGEVIGDMGGWLGLSEPDCDGPVFAPKQPVLVNVGQFMRRFPGNIPLNAPLGLMLWSDDSQLNGDGCGHPPSATIRVNLVLTRPPIKPPEFTQSFGVPTHFKPIASGIKMEKLIGTTWGDRESIEGSRVLVTVKPADSFHRTTSPSGLMNLQALRKQNPQLLELIGHPAASPAAVSGIPTPASVSFDVQENAASSPKSAIQISGASSPALPMQVSAYSGNQFPYNTAASGGLRGALTSPIKSKVAAAPADSTMQRSKVPYYVIAAKNSLVFADSFMLPSNVVLQVYGAYDAQERFAGTRIRYLRIDSAGKVVTDAMLEPAQRVPR
jgi:hypothetical protein